MQPELRVIRVDQGIAKKWRDAGEGAPAQTQAPARALGFGSAELDEGGRLGVLTREDA